MCVCCTGLRRRGATPSVCGEPRRSTLLALAEHNSSTNRREGSRSYRLSCLYVCTRRVKHHSSVCIFQIVFLWPLSTPLVASPPTCRRQNTYIITSLRHPCTSAHVLPNFRARGETCAHGKRRTENTPKVALVAPGLKKRSRPRGTGGIIRANLVATAREEATTVAAAATTMMNRTLKQLSRRKCRACAPTAARVCIEGI